MEKIYRQLDEDKLILVVGLRRSGKSCLAKQLENELKEEFAATAQVIRCNFEQINMARITGDDLIEYYRQRRMEGKTCYVLLDEITHVLDWERAVNFIKGQDGCKVILFSSNRKIISPDLDAVKSDRYAVIHALPLSLPEFISFQGFQETTPADTLVCDKRYVRFDGKAYTLKDIYNSYITYGGLPVMKPEYMDEERAWVVTDGSYGAIVTRDVLEIGNVNGSSTITDTVLLRSVITIMAKSVGDNISATWTGKQTAKYLQRPSSTKTIESYIRSLLNAHLFYIAERYDIRAAKPLKTLAKYYIADASLHHYVTGIRAEDEYRLLENKVFFELLRRDYQVNNGKLGSEEVTLIAKNRQHKAYIQVPGDAREESINHLLSTLRKIRDNYPKMVIAFDRPTQTLADGILILNALEFLMGGSWTR
ncbi:MAG: ATP-binding protein [Firmicutes bacterium]|nr:ATP-binding protein [Bacillota bacterium]